MPIDAGLQCERRGHEMAALVASAGCDLDRQGARRQSRRDERRALVVGRPLQGRDLAAHRHLDRHRLHHVVEGQLDRRARIDLHPVFQRAAVAGCDREDARDDDRRECPLPADDVVATRVRGGFQVDGVGGQLLQRLARSPCIPRLTGDGADRSVGRRRDRERRADRFDRD